MAKVSKAPRNFYSASQAAKKLGMPQATFFHHVRTGKITRVVPPGQSEGYYHKAEIDKLARAREIFTIEYAIDTSTFEIAREEDIQGITNLCVELFGKNGTASYEARLAQYRKNPEIFYVVRQDDLIVGYVGIIPLKKEAIDKIMSGSAESAMRTGILTPENIVQFQPGEAEHVFLVIGVRQKLSKSSKYGARALSGCLEVLEKLAKNGVIIKKLYGTSRTSDGIRIAKGFGFREVTPPNNEDDLLRFELDLETTTSPLFKEYQQIVKRRRKKSSQ